MKFQISNNKSQIIFNEQNTMLKHPLIVSDVEHVYWSLPEILYLLIVVSGLTYNYRIL